MTSRLIRFNPVDVHIATYNHEAIRRQTLIVQRAAVTQLAEKVLGPGIRLEHRPDGSPFAPMRNDVEVSVSHCSGIVAIGVAPAESGRIGIDIERLRPTLVRVRRKFLSEAEMERWTSLSELLQAWTVKEAVYKAAGITGLDFANGIKLPDEPADEMIVVVTHNSDERLYAVTTTSIAPDAALAVACLIP